MNGTNEILEELRSLSPSVAGISRLTPYQVPEDYFKQLPETALKRVSGWKDAKSLTYNVPEGYFDGFAQGVLARIKAGAAAADADPVSDLLAQIGRDTPYRVPEGYFGELSPLLAVLRDQHPYVAPEGYFDTFPAVVLAKTEQSSAPAAGEARVISLQTRKRRSLGWMRYSAAAVLAGLIFTVGWLRWHRPAANGPASQTEIANRLSNVSDAELQNFLSDQDTTLAQPLSNISNNTATIDMNDIDFKTLIGDVPDGELKQYMEEHGGAQDIATN
ncbi:MAG TPA: hypothetical protein VHE54_19705 [Puia sp.]|nr:hypothetical protein [Puia sp.]